MQWYPGIVFHNAIKDDYLGKWVQCAKAKPNSILTRSACVECEISLIESKHSWYLVKTCSHTRMSKTFAICKELKSQQTENKAVGESYYVIILICFFLQLVSDF